MTIRRWDPFRELLTLQERMNRIFDESMARGRVEGAPTRSGVWAPPADAFETADSVVVELEVAGVEREDVQITVEQDVLTITGVRRPVRPDTYHRMERTHGRFARQFRLTSEVDAEDVKARLDDGVLHIEIPKTGARERS